MFGFNKKCFFTGLAFLLTLASINMLSCISMNNQECKIRPQIIHVNGDDTVFFLCVFTVVVTTITVTHSQNYVFLIL